MMNTNTNENENTKCNKYKYTNMVESTNRNTNKWINVALMFWETAAKRAEYGVSRDQAVCWANAKQNANARHFKLLFVCISQA